MVRSRATTIGGCVVIDDFVHSNLCAELLATVNDYRRRHTVPVIERRNGPLPLKYSVIDGDRIAQGLREVMNVYERVTRLVKQLCHDALEPLSDHKVACNINITQPGGSYRYHYDRNALTAILYLNATRGGETECYPELPFVARTGSLFKPATKTRSRSAKPLRAICGCDSTARASTSRAAADHAGQSLPAQRQAGAREPGPHQHRHVLRSPRRALRHRR